MVAMSGDCGNVGYGCGGGEGSVIVGSGGGDDGSNVSGDGGGSNSGGGAMVATSGDCDNVGYGCGGSDESGIVRSGGNGGSNTDGDGNVSSGNDDDLGIFVLKGSRSVKVETTENRNVHRPSTPNYATLRPTLHHPLPHPPTSSMVPSIIGFRIEYGSTNLEAVLPDRLLTNNSHNFHPTVATKVVCLTHTIYSDELKDDEDYEEILDDMRQECSKFANS
ncbi:hypothetical protein JHK86_006430 [Glycine max]|nr:hypothetical protein JHK86_006430 [Glycine max]